MEGVGASVSCNGETSRLDRPRDRMLFVGLEIGGTNLKAGVLDGDTGALLGNFHQEPLLKDSSTQESQVVVDQLIKLGEQVLEEQGITWLDTQHIGIACPGQIDTDTGVVVGASSFPTWSNVPLAELVKDKTGTPATVLNDASAAASAEFAGRGTEETIVVLTLGTGIGLGLVYEGRVVSGSRGLIEGGHMIVEPGPKGRPCSCGQRGCLEAYASASSVARIASERMQRALPFPSGNSPPRRASVGEEGKKRSLSPIPHSPNPTQAAPVFPRRRRGSRAGSLSGVSERIRELERRSSLDTRAAGSPLSPPSKASSLSDKVHGAEGSKSSRATAAAVPSSRNGSLGIGSGGTFTAADVCAMARLGDEVAIEVVEETCAYLGVACVNICRMLDPDAILLTGGLSKAEGLVDKVREAFLSRGWSVLPHECEIGLASTCATSSPGVMGAASAAASEHAREARRERSRRSSPCNSRPRDESDHAAQDASSVDNEDSDIARVCNSSTENVTAGNEGQGTQGSSEEAQLKSNCSRSEVDNPASSEQSVGCEGAVAASARKRGGSERVGWFLVGLGVGAAVASSMVIAATRGRGSRADIR